MTSQRSGGGDDVIAVQSSGAAVKVPPPQSYTTCCGGVALSLELDLTCDDGGSRTWVANVQIRAGIGELNIARTRTFLRGLLTM
jgi:hypothetical protein